jgi:hypothetical protein
MNEDKKYYDTVSKLCNSSTVYKSITEEEFEQILTKGGKTYLKKIFEIRNPETNQSRKDYLKLQLPGIAFQARFKDGHKNRNRYNIKELTGEILVEEDGVQFDVDGKIIKFSSPEEARAKRNEVIAENWRYIKYAYDSANIRNHYVIRITGLTVQNFSAACKYVAKLMGIVIDPKGIHPSRLAALSYDPNAYINKTDLDYIDVSIVKEKEKKMVQVNAPVTKTNLRANGKHKFFSQSLADVHLSDFISQNLENIIFYPEGYVVAIQKLPMIKLFGRRTHIHHGERNETLFRDFSLYVSLNGCNQTNEQLWSGFTNYSRKWCNPVLEEWELKEIFNKVMDRFASGSLSIGAFEQNGAWYSWCKLGGTGRKSLSSTAKKHRNILLFLSDLAKLKLTDKEKHNISVGELAIRLDMPKQTIYNYQKYIQAVIPTGAKSKNDICIALDKVAFVKNEITSLTISNIILYIIGEEGLYVYGFLHPQKTVRDVIQKFLDCGTKITKQTIAEELGCSDDTVRRSNDWKEYQKKLNESNIKHRDQEPTSIDVILCDIEASINDIAISLTSEPKPKFDYHERPWFINLTESEKEKYENEIINGRDFIDVWLEVNERSLPSIVQEEFT